jgi:hypothetical protein
MGIEFMNGDTPRVWLRQGRKAPASPAAAPARVARKNRACLGRKPNYMREQFNWVREMPGNRRSADR